MNMRIVEQNYTSCF